MRIAIIALALVLVGCAVARELVPTGGSRADGVVELSLQHGPFDRPQVDMIAATRTAAETCRVWGYTGAQRFGGQIETCQRQGGYVCDRTLVTVRFQCTGGAPGGR